MIPDTQRFDRLRQRYAASLTRKRQDLDAAWRRLQADPHDARACADLQDQVHRLAGSAPAYGYEAIGLLAREADRLLTAWREPATPRPDGDPMPVATIASPMRVLLATLREADVGTPRLRVVLVDDDPTFARLCADELEAEGCGVRVETDAHELPQVLAGEPCHAVVLDYWLRGETAAEIAASLRRDGRFATLALVCYTAEADERVVRSALEAGCDAALHKCDGPQRLFETVRACVARPDRSGRRFD